MTMYLSDPGVWMAYYYDWSGFVIFANEIDALRYAVTHSCAVGFLPWGREGRDPLDGPPDSE